MPPAAPHLPQLDGLRALAVAGVLLWHFAPASAAVLPWGPLGVRLFFVLSGFLITDILLGCRRRVDAGACTTGFAVRRFYARRFLRIFPIYYLTLAVAAALDLVPVRATLPWHLAYATNVYVARSGTWPGPVAHFWSLSIEEQFYLVWPWLVLGLPQRAIRPALLCLVAAGPAFRVACGLAGLTWWLGTYVLLPASLDALAFGGLLAAERHGGAPGRVTRWLLGPRAGWIGPGLLAAGHATRVLGFNTAAAGVADTLDAAGFTWLVGRAAGGFRGRAGRLLEAPALRWVGKVSYGIYVYHAFMLDAVPWALRRVGLAVPETAAVRLLLLSGATLAVAAVSWHVLEAPVNRLKRYFPYEPAPPRLTAVAAAR